MQLTRMLVSTIAALLFLTGGSSAQELPDFTGVWALDPGQSDARGVYGQLRVIAQSPDHVAMTVLHLTPDRLSITPWSLPFNKWRPRRGGESSKEPIVQSRWDGRRLVTLKAPGTSYSVLWIWSLSADGNTLVSEAVSTGIGFSFDFTASSTPQGYTPDRHAYRRVATDICVDCLLGSTGRFSLRLADKATRLLITCDAPTCAVIDVVAGRQSGARSLRAGGTSAVSLAANTIVQSGD